MRIAVSGAHRTGKTTLVGKLVASHPKFRAVDEPYYLLENEGHAFADVPGFDDFELQLERSITAIQESGQDDLFDRCPLDMLAYLAVHDESERFDVDRWLPRLRDVMRQLDLIVFVPIEDPERIPASELDHRRLRRRVNEELQDIVLDDKWAFGVPTIEVSGDAHERAGQVLAHLKNHFESRGIGEEGVC